MYLHENRELFEELIDAASDYMGVNRETIEKDYYVIWVRQGGKN